MKMKDRTKNMFADTLEEMLKIMPFEKVRVSKLCEQCGAAPPTFYYYFRDKYELVTWIFLQDFSEAVGEGSSEYTQEFLRAITMQIEKRRVFYKKVFTDRSQNSIGEYIQDFNVELFRKAVKQTTGEDLSAYQLSAIKYHNYGIVGIFREWLFGEDIPFDEMNQLLFEQTPDFLKEAFSAYKYLAENILQRKGNTSRRSPKP